MFEFTTWHASFADFFSKLRRYTVIWKQLLFANDRNRVRRPVFGLSQDRACTNLFENFRKNSLKQDLSNDTIVNPCLFSLVNTFKAIAVFYFSRLWNSFHCIAYVLSRIRIHHFKSFESGSWDSERRTKKKNFKSSFDFWFTFQLFWSADRNVLQKN